MHIKADYVRTRSQIDAHFAQLVADYLKQYDGASRTEIDDLLSRCMPEDLDPKQQRATVTNLLSRMCMNGTIENTGTRPKPRWEIV